MNHPIHTMSGFPTELPNAACREALKPKVVLWLQIKQVPERAIAGLPNSIRF